MLLRRSFKWNRSRIIFDGVEGVGNSLQGLKGTHPIDVPVDGSLGQDFSELPLEPLHRDGLDVFIFSALSEGGGGGKSAAEHANSFYLNNHDVIPLSGIWTVLRGR
jgi:hypothetical protein